MLPPSLHAAINRACSPTFTGVELLCPPRNWPPARPGYPTRPSSPVAPHIAVFDSSFNPPTRAHLAIAATPFPPPYRENYHNHHTPDSAEGNGIHEPGPYTARLLLYSPKNADKTPSSTDASVSQRAAMMLAQARVLDSLTSDDGGEGGAVAVGLIQAPTFVAKAQLLIDALRVAPAQEDGAIDSPATPPQPALTFLVGTDTLVRIFDPKYYTDMPAALAALFEHSWLVSVRRGDDGDLATEAALLQLPEVDRWVRAGKVRILDRLEEAVTRVSSTAVRAAVRGESGAEGSVLDELHALVVPEVAEMVVSQGLYR